MGSYLTNYHIRSNSHETVVRTVRSSIRGEAYLSKVREGWFSLYDARTDRQDLAELHRLAGLLSAGCGTAVWGFLVHDSDVLIYVLYDKGDLVDEYSSDPDYFGSISDSRRARLAGQPEVARRYARSDTKVEQFVQFLGGSAAAPASAPSEDPLLAKMREQMRQFGPNPGDYGKVLEQAADQIGSVSPQLLKGMLERAGVPLDNPMLAPLLQDPASYLKQLARNPMAMAMMNQQIQTFLEHPPQPASTEATAEAPHELAEIRLLSLARLIGLEARAVTISFDSFSRGEVKDAEEYEFLQAD